MSIYDTETQAAARRPSQSPTSETRLATISISHLPSNRRDNLKTR